MAQPKGFTLVELMIVVAIVAILAAISIPRFQVYRVTALRTEAVLALDLINASQIGGMSALDHFSPAYADLGLTEYMAKLKYFARPSNYLPFWACGLNDICLLPADGTGGYIAVLIADLDHNPEANEYLNDVWLVHYQFPAALIGNKEGIPVHLYDDFLNPAL